jgi:hypothetical protein
MAKQAKKNQARPRREQKDSPTQAIESGEPKFAGRTRGQSNAAPRPGKGGDSDHPESGRHDAAR